MRIRHILFCSLIFCSVWAQAEVYIWPVIVKARAERTENQDLKLRSNQYPSLGASYRFETWLVSLDYSRYENTSDNGNVSIETQYSDIGIWGDYRLFTGDIWDFYATAGTAVYQQKVTTTVGVTSTSGTSHDRNLIGAGIEILMRTPSSVSGLAGVRMNWTQDLQPELMPEMYLKLGIGF